MSSGMKRLAWTLVVAALSVAALLLLIVTLIPRDMLKTRIGEQIAGWTGREVSLRGDPKLGIFPTLSVTLDDVEIGGPQGMDDAQILSMDRLKGTIRLLPLIIGRVEIDTFTMVRPLVRLVRDEKGQRNWEFDSSAAALQLAFSGDVPLGKFRLEGGTVVYEDRQSGDTERLDSVNLSIEWRSVRNPISVDGSGIWRGEQVSFSGNAGTPFAYLNGAVTPIEARIEAAPINMTLTGEADDYPRAHASGALKLSTPSLRRFASWLGSSVGPGSTLGQTSLLGTAVFRDGVLSVENAQFALDGNSATGALKIALGTMRPEFTGTLAFGALDLTPYFAGLSAALSLGADWRRVALPTDWLSGMSADIRLSADSVKLATLTAGNAAASVSLRDRRLEVGLARVAFNEGSVSGDLAIDHSSGAQGADVAAQFRATDVGLSEVAPFLGLPDGISGAATLVVDATAKGRDLGSLVGALGGSAKLGVVEGSLPLFGLAEVATAEDGGADLAASASFEPKPVQSATVGLSFAGGVGTVDEAEVVTPDFSADAKGWVRLLDGTLAVSGTLHPGAPGATTAAATPFAIDGTLERPVAHRLILAN
jgi:AsmA protein